MDELRKEQLEALETLVEYSPKLLNGIDTSAAELGGERKEDTDGYLRLVIDGINWELSIINSCLDLINEGETRIDKSLANAASVRFSEAFASGVDARIAESLKNDIRPLIENLTAASKAIL